MIDSRIPQDPGERTRSAQRRAIILLSIAAGILFFVIIAVVIALLVPQSNGASRGVSSTSSAAPTPMVSLIPTASVPPALATSEADPPADPAATITTFSVNPEQVICPEDPSAIQLTFSWSTTHAERVWIGVETTDAEADTFAAVGTDETGYTSISFKCGEAEAVTYTLTAKGATGTVHASVVVAKAS